MEDLFRDFWWLIFPLFGIAMGAFNSMTQYRRQKAVLDIIRTYAEKGEQPPEALLGRLDQGDASNSDRSPAHFWSLTGLFGVMALGFGAASWSYGFAGVGWPLGIVAIVMGAVGVWALLNAVLIGRAKR